MSVNTYATIKELAKSFLLSVKDADTGELLEGQKYSTLKQALNAYHKKQQQGEIEYGLTNIELTSDIIKGEKTKLKV